jgi:hypothetical protein
MIVFQAGLGKKQDLISKIPELKNAWWSGLSGRTPA